MTKFVERLDAITDLRMSHTSLSIGRIAIFCVFLLEYLHIFQNRQASLPDAIYAYGALPCSMVACVALILGAGTRAAALIHLVSTQMWLRAIADHYHLDYLIASLGFAFLVSPTPRALAVDGWLAKRAGRPMPPLRVPRWFVLLLLLAIGLVYYDSLYFKFRSLLWTNGLSFWLPATVPHFAVGVLPEWAENRPLMAAAGYAALVFESVFVLAIFQRLRFGLVVMGIALHLGIAIFFPVPLFGLAVVALFLAFLPWPEWIARWNGIEPVELMAIPAGRVRLATRAGGFGVCILLVVLQNFLIFGSPPLNVLRVNRLFGLERHGVYVDWHFQLATPVIRLTTVIDGREVVIPSFDAEGHPEVRGRYWVTWTFPLRTNLNGFYKHSERFVRAYFKDRGLTPRDVRVEMRPAWVPLRWDFETVERLKAETWMDGGRMRFDGERYIHELTPALETEMGRGIVRSRM